jgi:hypothetical protein
VDTARRLDDRFANAFQTIVSRWPDAFRSTELDAEGNQRKMETLVKRVEDLARSLRGPAKSDDAALSPTARLATMLKEALAANTIGGKADEEGRFRAAIEDVRQAEAAWSRIGLVPADARRELHGRFARACREIIDRAGKAGQTGGA